MGTMPKVVEIDGTEYELEVEYNFTPGRPARFGNDPDDSHPAEPAEIEVTGVRIDVGPTLPANAAKQSWKKVPEDLWGLFGVEKDDIEEAVMEYERDEAESRASDEADRRVDEMKERDDDGVRNDREAD